MLDFTECGRRFSEAELWNRVVVIILVMRLQAVSCYSYEVQLKGGWMNEGMIENGALVE